MIQSNTKAFFLAASAGADHATDQFSTIGCGIITDFTSEAGLRLFQHLIWSSMRQ